MRQKFPYNQLDIWNPWSWKSIASLWSGAVFIYSCNSVARQEGSICWPSGVLKAFWLNWHPSKPRNVPSVAWRSDCSTQVKSFCRESHINVSKHKQLLVINYLLATWHNSISANSMRATWRNSPGIPMSERKEIKDLFPAWKHEVQGMSRTRFKFASRIALLEVGLYCVPGCTLCAWCHLMLIRRHLAARKKASWPKNASLFFWFCVQA